jgi:hypothetical protein
MECDQLIRFPHVFRPTLSSFSCEKVPLRTTTRPGRRECSTKLYRPGVGNSDSPQLLPVRCQTEGNRADEALRGFELLRVVLVEEEPERFCQRTVGDLVHVQNRRLVRA